MLLIVETITWKPHIETAMEIALTHRETGEDVVFANLRRGLPVCEDSHPVHWLMDLPEHRIRRSAEILADRGVAHVRPPYSRAERKAALRAAAGLLSGCASVEDLKAVRYGEFTDIGWGALSSVASVTRNSMLSLERHGGFFRRYLAAAILVFETTRSLIRQYRPTRVLAFNGRFATTRAVLRAAEAEATPWLLHERGADKDHYWLLDTLPHDLDRIQEDMLRQWSDSARDAGSRFFELRRERVERGWHSFTRDQQRGLLPEAMRDESPWVTFFTSSEDEMFAIGDRFAAREFPTQDLAIRALADAVAQNPGLKLCIRVHPHIAQKSKSDRAKWQNLAIPGALVIGPEERFDSYALMDRSLVVCTYGSTMGIEATYWGRPSLLFARAFYDRLDAVEQAVDHDQIVAFLRDPRARPRDRALPYGAFFERLGQPYRFYRAENLHKGTICGIDLDDSPWLNSGKKLARMLSRSRRH